MPFLDFLTLSLGAARTSAHEGPSKFFGRPAGHTMPDTEGSSPLKRNKNPHIPPVAAELERYASQPLIITGHQ